MTTQDPANPEQDDLDDRPCNREKDGPATGDERMTGAQASYLKTLCEEAREEFDLHITRAAAAKRIDELQRVTGLGVPVDDTPPPGSVTR